MASTGIQALGDPNASTVLATDRRDHYLRPNTFSELYPNVAPFYTFVSKLRTLGGNELKDVDFKLFYHKNIVVDSFRFYINGSVDAIPAAGSDVTPNIDDGSGSAPGFVVPGQVVRVRTSAGTLKAYMRVKSVASNGLSATLTTIYRSGSPSFADNDVLDIVGTAYGEGSAAPDSWYDDLSTLWNSVQTFRTSLKLTDQMIRAVLRGGKEMPIQIQRKAMEHKMNIARDFYFGMRPNGVSAPSTTISDSDGNIVTLTQGIISAIKYLSLTGANYFVADSTTYTWDDFVDDMKQVAQYANAKQTLYGFGGYDVIAWFGKVGSGTSFAGNSGFNFQLAPTVQTRFGFQVKRIEHQFGTLNLVLDPLLRGPDAGYLLIVDPEHIGRAQWEPPRFRQNIQERKYLYTWHEYVSIEGLWFDQIESHALFELT